MIFYKKNSILFKCEKIFDFPFNKIKDYGIQTNNFMDLLNQKEKSNDIIVSKIFTTTLNITNITKIFEFNSLYKSLYNGNIDIYDVLFKYINTTLIQPQSQELTILEESQNGGILFYNINIERKTTINFYFFKSNNYHINLQIGEFGKS